MNHWLTNTAMLMAATAPAPDATPWAQWGLAGVVIGIVIWQSWQRECRLGARIDELENRQMALHERSIIAAERMAAAVEALAKTPCPRETAGQTQESNK